MVDNITVPCVCMSYTQAYMYGAREQVSMTSSIERMTRALYTYTKLILKNLWCRWAHKRFRHLLHIVGVYPIEYVRCRNHIFVCKNTTSRKCVRMIKSHKPFYDLKSPLTLQPRAFFVSKPISRSESIKPTN